MMEMIALFPDLSPCKIIAGFGFPVLISDGAPTPPIFRPRLQRRAVIYKPLDNLRTTCCLIQGLFIQ
jgi:hypothetical protein